MIFAELPLEDSLGAMLAHAISLNGARIPKGRAVDADLAAAARAAGLRRLWVFRPEPGDVAEADAAQTLAQTLAGQGTEPRPPVHGRVNLHATTAGLLLVDAAAIHALNATGDQIAVSTLASDTPVAVGDLVATIKIIPYALDAAQMAAATAAARPAVHVHGWQPARVSLLQTRLAETPDKLLARTARVTAQRLERLGQVMDELPPIPHGIDELAAALTASTAPLLLVAGATATSDRRDVIPAAIVAAGGIVDRVGMPVDPGNLLVLGRIRAATVIGLPGCARSPKRNGLDLILERLAAGLPISADMVTRLGVGGLLEESGRKLPWGWTG